MCLLGSDYNYLPLRVGPTLRKRFPSRMFAAVDVCDYAWLIRFHWLVTCDRGGRIYAVADIGGVVGMHRFILLTLNPHLRDRTAPRFYADHRNGYTLDNRRRNLRVASREENKANRWPYMELAEG